MIYNSENILNANHQKIYYRRIEGFRKESVMYNYNQEELKELSNSYASPEYFIEKFCKILTSTGFNSIKLYGFQEEICQNFKDNRFNIIAHSRQAGISELINLFALYLAIFSKQKILLVNTKLEMAIGKMEKIQMIYKNLPFFIKPGVTNYDKFSINFENGSYIQCSSKFSGFNEIDSIFVDSFAYMNTIEKKNFLRNVVPRLSCDGRIFIASDPNGPEEFSKLFKNAERKALDPKKNVFVPFRVYWWEVPNRDYEWEQRQIKMLGSDLFDRYYDLDFS